MEQIVNSLKLFRPALNHVLIDLWTMVKNQGLSFLLMAGFIVYQMRVNIDQADKINYLQQELLTYLKVDKIKLVETIDKNNELLQENKNMLLYLREGAK
jgi:hypothetical protein